jgi:hypothetical protein
MPIYEITASWTELERQSFASVANYTDQATDYVESNFPSYPNTLKVQLITMMVNNSNGQWATSVKYLAAQEHLTRKQDDD